MWAVGRVNGEEVANIGNITVDQLEIDIRNGVTLLQMYCTFFQYLGLFIDIFVTSSCTAIMGRNVFWVIVVVAWVIPSLLALGSPSVPESSFWACPPAQT